MEGWQKTKDDNSSHEPLGQLSYKLQVEQISKTLWIKKFTDTQHINVTSGFLFLTCFIEPLIILEGNFMYIVHVHCIDIYYIWRSKYQMYCLLADENTTKFVRGWWRYIFDNFLVDITGCNAACSSSHPAGKTRNFFLTVSTSNSDFLLFGF
jgi:hypothetical protein